MTGEQGVDPQRYIARLEQRLAAEVMQRERLAALVDQLVDELEQVRATPPTTPGEA